jgi:hypothetical protein
MRKRYIYILLTLGILSVGCSTSPRAEVSEVILFVTLGQQPFQDSVSTINLDGSGLRRILTPKKGRSYIYASGNSLQSELVLTVHEFDLAGQIIDHLYLYNPASDSESGWRRLIKEHGMEGAGYMSPDGSRVAFIFAPHTQPVQLRPWVTNLQSGETIKLTGEDNDEGGWDGYLSWRPDGQEIIFLRLRRVPGGLTSILMRVPARGGEPTEVLEPDEWVFAACYAPDGKSIAVLTKKGLEICEVASKQRRLILTWDSLPSPQFRTGGLIWSRDQDTLAFAILNKQAKRYELWTLSSDGQDAKKIYDQDESKGQLTVTAFVRAQQG